MRSEIKRRYKTIKQATIEYVQQSLTGFVQEPTKSAVFIKDTLYVVNADYRYAIDGNQLARVLTRIQEIVDESFVDGGIEKFWAGKFVADMYKTGINRAFHNLSAQSPVYTQATSLESLLFSEGYIRRIGLAYTATFNDWKSIADDLKGDLGNVLSNAVARGINPRETADIISKRIDVSYSKAKAIAQTEQVGALRQAACDETKRVQDELGLKTGLLHLSALKPNSRATHVDRHGKVYTVEQVQDWYDENGNRFNCYCAQVAVLLNDKGEPYNKAYIERLKNDVNEWKSQNDKGVINPDFSSVEEINKWASGKLTQICKIPSNVDFDELTQCIKLVSELQKRFNLPKFRYIGSLTADVYTYQQDEKMIAAFAPEVNSLLITPRSLSRKDILNDDIISRTANYKALSLNVAEYANHKTLKNIINQMEYLPWHAVPTPRGVYAHEMGHVLHKKYGIQLEKIAREGWYDGWAFVLSKYSQKEIDEFIAESFSLFIEDKLEAKKRLYPPLFEFFNLIDKAK